MPRGEASRNRVGNRFFLERHWNAQILAYIRLVIKSPFLVSGGGQDW